MPRGYPDWGRIKKEVGITALGDLGELAVRLGALPRWDRAGDVLFFDDFSQGLDHWLTVSIPVSEYPKITLESSEYGGYSVKFMPSDGGSNWQEIQQVLAYPLATRLGFEFSFTTQVYLLYLETFVFLFYPTGKYEFGIRYNRLDKEMLYRDKDGVWQTIWSNYELRDDPLLFHHLKLVVDSEKNEYVRLFVDQNHADLKGIPGLLAAEVGSESIYILIRAYAQSGKTATIYVDSCVVTMNEP